MPGGCGVAVEPLAAGSAASATAKSDFRGLSGRGVSAVHEPFSERGGH